MEKEVFVWVLWCGLGRVHSRGVLCVLHGEWNLDDDGELLQYVIED